MCVLKELSSRETLKKTSQRSCGCSIPRSAQGQAGQGFEGPGLVKVFLSMAGEFGTRWSLKYFPTQTILSFYDSKENIKLNNGMVIFQRVGEV